MSEPVKPPVSEPTIVGLQGQILALRLAMSALIAAMPEDQRAFVTVALKEQVNATDQLNADQPAFTVGEEATHQMVITSREILTLVDQFRVLAAKP